MTFFDTLRNALLLGFGVQEKVSEFVNELVKKGELSESQGAKLVREWTEKADKNTEQLTKGFSEIVSKSIDRLVIPTKSDIEQLNAKIEGLSMRVKKLEGAHSEPVHKVEESPKEE